MEAIERIIITPIKDLLGKTDLGIDIMLAIAGAAVIIIAFFIALIFKGCSNVKALGKKLDAAAGYLKDNEEITEENVEGLNSLIKKMPESIERGWGSFLDQKVGYPSDYITRRDVFYDKKFSGKNTVGKVFFRIFSVIVIALTIWIEYVINKGASLATIGLEDFTANFELVGAILAAFCAPLVIYVIFSIILNAVYNAQQNKLDESFIAFQNALDDKVLISVEEEDEFVSENIEEINSAIEDIISNKIDKKEIIEIVTTPKIEEKEIVETVSVEENEEEVAAAAAEEEIALTPEEEQTKLSALVNLIDNAVFYDDNITNQEVEELAIIIFTEKEKGFRSPADQNALEECLMKLAEKSRLLKNVK